MNDSPTGRGPRPFDSPPGAGVAGTGAGFAQVVALATCTS